MDFEPAVEKNNGQRKEKVVEVEAPRIPRLPNEILISVSPKMPFTDSARIKTNKIHKIVHR